MEFPSKLIEDAVEEFAQLPGVGKKTALRFVLNLLKKEPEATEQFAYAMLKLRRDIKFCKQCCNVTEQEICSICANPLRDESTLCIVQDIRDVMAIENTGLYKGHYHVLGGVISPMEGISPLNLNIDSMLRRMESEKIKEVIIALSANMEGETTTFYIYKKLIPFNVKFSIIARGLAVGDELEYADEATLGRSIQNRVPYNNEMLR